MTLPLAEDLVVPADVPVVKFSYRRPRVGADVLHSFRSQFGIT